MLLFVVVLLFVCVLCLYHIFVDSFINIKLLTLIGGKNGVSDA